MRQRADWMRPADDRVLEFLRSEGTNLPTNVAEELSLSRKYVGERCRILADYGLLENLGQGVYRITEEGEQYLDGELDAEELVSKKEDS